MFENYFYMFCVCAFFSTGDSLERNDIFQFSRRCRHYSQGRPRPRLPAVYLHTLPHFQQNVSRSSIPPFARIEVLHPAQRCSKLYHQPRSHTNTRASKNAVNVLPITMLVPLSWGHIFTGGGGAPLDRRPKKNEAWKTSGKPAPRRERRRSNAPGRRARGDAWKSSERWPREPGGYMWPPSVWRGGRREEITEHRVRAYVAFFCIVV